MQNKKINFSTSALHRGERGDSCCCILHGPGGERIMDVVPGGMELEIQFRRGVGRAAHTRNNPHVKYTGVY